MKKTNEQNNTKTLQERLEEVFPTFKGTTEEMLNAAVQASKEYNFLLALVYAFDYESSLPTTSQEWEKLDWALSVPGVSQMFPELTKAVKEHYTLKVSYKDFTEVVANIILAASEIARDTVNAEGTIDCFKSTFEHYLPEELASSVNNLLTKEMVNWCRAKGLPVDQKLCDRFFYRLDA